MKWPLQDIKINLIILFELNDQVLAVPLALLLFPFAGPAVAQTVTPSSGVWTTTTSGSTVTTSTTTTSTPPPFVFSFNQPTSSGSFPATVNATLMGYGAGNWATNTYTYNGPIYQFSGAGTQGSISNPQQGYIVGPAFSAGIASGASLWNTGASFAPPSKTSLAGTPSLLTISSNGAPGADPETAIILKVAPTTPAPAAASRSPRTPP